MGDFSDLTDDCLINLLFSMAMDIDPEGGNSVKIPPPINVFHIGSLAFLNDKRRDSTIIPHLGEGMPQHVLIDLLKMSNIQFSSNFLHGRMVFVLSGRSIGFKTNRRGAPLRLPAGRQGLPGRPHLCAEALRCAGTEGRPYEALRHFSDYQMSPSSLPTFSNFSKAKFISSRVWVAITVTLKRHFPSGTVGGRIPWTKTLPSRSLRSISMEMDRRLLEGKVFVQGIRPPTVPEGKCRLRVTVMATHTREDINFALEKFEKVGKELGLI